MNNEFLTSYFEIWIYVLFGFALLSVIWKIFKKVFKKLRLKM